uniref:Glycine-rich protein n=2 Tax=Physcomitrium patens TaxID=3218 RepID=A0A2K1JLM1_PHYPA|nr:hypothetical protein PHYPA_017260 [Physcomitrium patens]
MAGYVQSGEVRARRSPWRLSIIPEMFSALIALIISFFSTMFSLDAHRSYGKRPASGGNSFGGGSGPGGPGGSGGGGGYGPRRPRGLDSVRGVDHSAPSPCGSCCAG